MKKIIKRITTIILLLIIIITTNQYDLTIKKTAIDSSIVGKIKVSGTSIDENVVKHTDNEYYLDHDIYGNYDPKGSIFMDYRNNIEDKVILIYGHNSKTYNIPFRELEKYYKENFFKKNKIIYLKIGNKNIKYEIFSIFIEYKDWSYTKIHFKEDEYLDHLNYLKNKSWYKSNITLSKDDNIIILQTCSYHKDYKKYKNKYLLVIAKEIV